MNTKLLKPLGLMALGGVAGGIVGYFLSSLILDRMLQTQEEFEWEEEDIAAEELKVGTPTPAASARKIVNKIDYTKFGEKGDLEELVRPYATKKQDNPKSKQDNIRIISLLEYESNRTVNRELISYYSGDTTFCDANEGIIPNPEDFFGPNVHLHFGEESGDADIVYVENGNNGVSYEITRYKGKYSVIVMGMAEEEPKETKAKRRRSKKVEEIPDSEESIDDEEGEG